MPQIKLIYDQRPHFAPFHARDVRWAILVAHRRAGKTVAVVNDLLEKAAYNTLKNPRYGYVAPLYNQAKQIAWQYLKDYAAPFAPKVSESGLFIELPHNGARITLYGADNPDSFRGLYFDGVALDEFGNMRQSIWTEVLLPTLIDRRGWAVFMGTPNGPNHFRDMYEKYRDDKSWYVAHMPYQKTGVIGDEDIRQVREIMTEEEFLQEMECSFEASTRGAFYSKEIATAEAAGMVVDFDYNLYLPMNFVFDLGYRDDTSAWAWQERNDGYDMCLSFSNNRQPISYYINAIDTICSLRGVPRGTVYLPHDARAHSLQTGRSIVEQFMQAGIQPEIVVNMGINDGISAARLLMPQVRFHKTDCKDGVMALKSYHREFDEDKKMFRDAPVHDWSSHYADSYRYFSLVAQKKPVKRRALEIDGMLQGTQGTHYAFHLEDLYEHRPKHDDNWRM